MRFSTAPKPSEITPPAVWTARRETLRKLAALGGLAASPWALAQSAPPPWGTPRSSPFSLTADKPTPFSTVTSYGNFYEFGPDKDSPAKHAHRLRTQPWQIRVEGEVLKPTTFGLDTLLKLAAMEERVYRMRCVEGWSAVIPWVGFPLAELIRRVQPTGNAKYVEFISLADPEQMPYVRLPLLSWPYTEALRLDEALHPLTLLAFGMYCEVMPKQNGAPVRLVVPWKYGFKSAKSIVRIRLVEQQPQTAWMKAGPSEYGFYSNVNPDVPHKRWSQSTERRLGEFSKRKTLPFNGYAEQVSQLYSGMDLRTHF